MESSPRASRVEPKKRGYDASRRQADAQQRLRRIVEAATRLFLDKGFGATSINEIAKAADVSAQTVYATFGSKAAVLARAVDVAIAGDYEDVAMIDRPRAWASPDSGDLFRMTAQVARESNARVGPLIRVVESAAGSDPQLEDLRLQLITGLRADCAAVLAELPEEILRQDLDLSSAADIAASLASASMYMTFVADMGWSPEKYEDWVAEALTRLLGRSPSDGHPAARKP
ncbi:TetR/AcrR family transcriptional regulator [Aldersonia kunmingensis]|uniref:TetR/AcrR family transcriptional regulator n=1 Tax=Aldersonia kunmingensis TaxID=408066 RepID=UPI000836DAC2|nr:TetR/AcrR family transcriptional regulator [Aldersonia kunmingensis]